jgi:hypothetical protein
MVSTRTRKYESTASKPKEPKKPTKPKPKRVNPSNAAIKAITNQHESVRALIQAKLPKRTIDLAKMSFDPVRLANLGKVEVMNQLKNGTVEDIVKQQWLPKEVKRMIVKLATYDVPKSEKKNFIVKYFTAKYGVLRLGKLHYLRKDEKAKHDAAWLQITKQLAASEMNTATIDYKVAVMKSNLDLFFYALRSRLTL